jgi:hypothetical protein
MLFLFSSPGLQSAKAGHRLCVWSDRRIILSANGRPVMLWVFGVL